MAGGRTAHPELRNGGALVHQAPVVRLLEVAVDPLYHLQRVVHARPAFTELLGSREQERHERFLVFGLDGQDVLADAFG